MRPLTILALTALTLTACKRETSEAVAEAKGAAADAKKAAEDAKRNADEAAAKAKAQAQATAAEANAKVHEMGQAVQQSVNDATAQTKAGVEKAGDKVQQGVQSAGQSIREIGEGNVVSGKLAASSAHGLVVASLGGTPVSLGADDQTRWVSKGGIGAREGVPPGSSVRVTYIVRDGQKVATLVEQQP